MGRDLHVNEPRSVDESTAPESRRVWMPKSISYAFGEPIVELAELEHLPGPFISDLDLGRATSTRRVPLMDLPASMFGDGRDPDGFLFHLPRSGSTLVARMLTAVPGVACVVEPEPINQLLSRGEPGMVRAEWLRRLVLLFRATCPAYSHVVVKLSSWAVLAVPLFDQAFPRSRRCFVHRDPLEVLVQLIERPTGWMAPYAWSLVLGEAGRANEMPLEEYCARVLGRCMRAAAALPDMRPLAYERLAADVPDVARYLLSRELDAAEVDAMLRITRFDSEDWSLSRPYVPDGDALRARATRAARRFVEQFAAVPRARLSTPNPR